MPELLKPLHVHVEDEEGVVGNVEPGEAAQAAEGEGQPGQVVPRHVQLLEIDQLAYCVGQVAQRDAL